MSKTENYEMVAKTMAELEDVLANELIKLGAQNVEVGNRMVSFTGDTALLYRANLHCRTALRILKPIHTFVANNADEVYEEIKKIEWDNYLTLDKTFMIDAVVFSHIFRHSQFVSYRVKDAIADYFYEKQGKRPSVSVSNPDLILNIHIAHNKCTLSLDSSGESLHKRGYRVAQTGAPLNEVLAAGMILKSGWQGNSNFVDPMCGSGTLLIEAAMIALNIPPGIHRENFAFEKWPDFDSDLFSEIYNDDSGATPFHHKIIGTDISGQAIAMAERNIKNAGLKNHISLEVKPLQQYVEAPQPPGVLMTNPPYGERIRIDDIDALYNMIGERLKHVFTGYEAYILSYKKENFDNLGLKPSQRFFLFNGALECEMRKYEIFAGKRDDRPKEATSSPRYKRDNQPVGRNRREFKQDFVAPSGDAPRRERRDREQPRDRRKDDDTHRNRGREDRDRSRDRERGRDRNRGRGERPYSQRGEGSAENRRYPSRSRGDYAADDTPHRTSSADDTPKRVIDLKKRKAEGYDNAPGAEKRVNKVFRSRKRRDDSDTNVEE